MEASDRSPSDAKWDAFATMESKSAITLWLLAGWAYNLFGGHLLSLSSLLLFVPGIFLASFAAIPSALLNEKKIRNLTEMKLGVRTQSVFELLGWTVWYVVGLVYVPILAILFVRFVNAWHE